MGVEWSKSVSFLREAAARLRLRQERSPIETVEMLGEFVSTRSAFVAQKKLYGYLKARMGTRYPTMFEDDVFVESINVAKLHVFAACLSDLSVHCVARVTVASGLEREDGVEMARRCFETGVADNAIHLPEPGVADKWRTSHEQRMAGVHWDNLAAGGDSFTGSPKALFQWAPIAEELKRYDREIVENSIRFAFGEVTREFRERATLSAIAADWSVHKGGYKEGPTAGRAFFATTETDQTE